MSCKGNLFVIDFDLYRLTLDLGLEVSSILIPCTEMQPDQRKKVLLSISTCVIHKCIDKYMCVVCVRVFVCARTDAYVYQKQLIISDS